MTDYIINAVAYVIVFWAWVFLINPCLWAMNDSHSDYNEAVFVPLILELVVLGVFAALAALIFSFNHVFGVSS